MKLILLFCASLWLCSTFSNSQRSVHNRTSNFQVGVILDLKSVVGSMGLSCMSVALSDFYSIHSNYSTRLSLHVRDSQEQAIEAAAAGKHYCILSTYVGLLTDMGKRSSCQFKENLPTLFALLQVSIC